MIYLIGGCPRAGKSTLARLLCQRLGVGWVSTDAIREVVKLANPAAGMTTTVEPNALAKQAELLYPMLEQLARIMRTVAGEYAIEGGEFLPRHADRLRSVVPVRACFMGWSQVTIEMIDAHGGPNDWTTGMDEPFRHALPSRLVELSVLHERECAAHRLPYVDMVGDFDDKLERAYGALAGA